jgi:hypothetical protein
MATHDTTSYGSEAGEEETAFPRIRLGTFDLVHDRDPYRPDPTLTLSRCTLDPERGVITVTQSRSGDGTTIAAWNNREIGIDLDFFDLGADPDAEELREFLTGKDGQRLLARIVTGYTTRWDHSNLVGELYAEGQEALEDLQIQIAGLSRTEVVDFFVRDFFEGREEEFVYALDGVIKESDLLSGVEEALAVARALHQHIIGDVEQHLRQYVEQVKRGERS